MIEAGTKLGRYEIRSMIGVGGMGEVYRATSHLTASGSSSIHPLESGKEAPFNVILNWTSTLKK